MSADGVENDSADRPLERLNACTNATNDYGSAGAAALPLSTAFAAAQRNRRPEQSAPSRFFRKEHPRFRPYMLQQSCAQRTKCALIVAGQHSDGATVALRGITGTGIIGCTATAHSSSSVSSHLRVSALHFTHFFTRGTPSKVSGTGSASAATVQRTSSHGATFWLGNRSPAADCSSILHMRLRTLAAAIGASGSLKIEIEFLSAQLD